MTSKRRQLEITDYAAEVRRQFGDPRRLKKLCRGSHVELAFDLGHCDGYRGRSKRNPYPPGRRHNEYERGYELSIRGGYYDRCA